MLVMNYLKNTDLKMSQFHDDIWRKYVMLYTCFDRMWFSSEQYFGEPGIS